MIRVISIEYVFIIQNFYTTKVCEKVDVITYQKKFANLDARQDAIRDVKMDANMGATGETKLDGMEVDAKEYTK